MLKPCEHKSLDIVDKKSGLASGDSERGESTCLELANGMQIKEISRKQKLRLDGSKREVKTLNSSII